MIGFPASPAELAAAGFDGHCSDSFFCFSYAKDRRLFCDFLRPGQVEPQRPRRREPREQGRRKRSSAGDGGDAAGWFDEPRPADFRPTSKAAAFSDDIPEGGRRAPKHNGAANPTSPMNPNPMRFVTTEWSTSSSRGGAVLCARSWFDRRACGREQLRGSPLARRRAPLWRTLPYKLDGSTRFGPTSPSGKSRLPQSRNGGRQNRR